MATDFISVVAGQRRWFERLLNGEGKMIGSAGRRGLWRLKDAHNKDNRAWKREKLVMVRGHFWA